MFYKKKTQTSDNWTRCQAGTQSWDSGNNLLPESLSFPLARHNKPTWEIRASLCKFFPPPPTRSSFCHGRSEVDGKNPWFQTRNNRISDATATAVLVSSNEIIWTCYTRGRRKLNLRFKITGVARLRASEMWKLVRLLYWKSSWIVVVCRGIRVK